MGKKKAARRVNPVHATVKELTWFQPDPAPLTTPGDKNDRLSDLLTTVWNPLEVVSVRRIEIGGQGWEATYRAIEDA